MAPLGLCRGATLVPSAEAILRLLLLLGTWLLITFNLALRLASRACDSVNGKLSDDHLGTKLLLTLTTGQSLPNNWKARLETTKMSGRVSISGSSINLIKACNLLEYLEVSGMTNWAFCMARVDSPNGNWKKHSLYRRQPKAQISDFVVIGLPLYKSIISGARYDNVVYFFISSSISITLWLSLLRNTLTVAEPKSHNW